ncbi:MAG: DUF1836 domain-containing protein [Eubacteriaceae bacterium]|nr:DUF1836 domain-containing protein [Eubacteriaceae bacterium]
MDIDEILKSLSEQRPIDWELIPDIELYMDQLLGYMGNQLLDAGPDSRVTPAMVNNYIRSGIMPRANKKKYSKEHIAKLTTICVMKQVLPVADLAILIDMFPGESTGQFYEKYRKVLNIDLDEVMGKIPKEPDDLDLAEAIARFTITSYANKIAAELLMDMAKQRLGIKVKRKKSK